MAKQRVTDEQIINAIVEFIEAYGYPPCFEDLTIALGYTSKSSIYERLIKLREKGLVDFLDNCSRTLTVPGYKFVKTDLLTK